MSYVPPFSINEKILDLVVLIGEEIGKISSVGKKPFKLRKKSLIKTLAGTLQIEGSTLDEKKITAILDGKRVLGTMQEVAEAKGAIDLYKKLEEFDFKSQEDLLESHKILMNDLLRDNGKYRHLNVGVGGKDGVTHVAPPYNVVPDLMRELFEWLNVTKLHPLIVSSIFHYEFEFIHPFSDGNGRMGRFWQSLILYEYKNIFASIPIESMVKQRQSAYYKALEKSSSEGENTPFIEYMLEVILDSIKEVQEQNVPKNAQENAQQLAQEILKEIEKNKFVTIKQLSALCGIGTRTVQKNINELKEKNLIQRVGANKGGYWEVLWSDGL